MAKRKLTNKVLADNYRDRSLQRIRPVLNLAVAECKYEADCVIRDMLADMMHYCKAHGIEFTKELLAASGHFDAEIQGQS